MPDIDIPVESSGQVQPTDPKQNPHVEESFQKNVQGKSIISTLSKFFCISSCCSQNTNISVSKEKDKS